MVRGRTRSKFPVFFPANREFGLPETGSLRTACSSSESATNAVLAALARYGPMNATELAQDIFGLWGTLRTKLPDRGIDKEGRGSWRMIVARFGHRRARTPDGQDAAGLFVLERGPAQRLDVSIPRARCS